MAKEMHIQAQLLSDLRFDITTGSGHHITLDSAEGNAGARPMEMLLVGLAGCSGMDIISILRKKRQIVTGYEIRIHGERAPEHPQVFTTITVEHIFTGTNIQIMAVERAIQLTEERYCGVSAMLVKTAQITHTFSIIEDVAPPND